MIHPFFYPFLAFNLPCSTLLRANNLANINAIVAKYRGANVVHLWAQLAIKQLYRLPRWARCCVF